MLLEFSEAFSNMSGVIALMPKGTAQHLARRPHFIDQHCDAGIPYQRRQIGIRGRTRSSDGFKRISGQGIPLDSFIEPLMIKALPTANMMDNPCD